MATYTFEKMQPLTVLTYSNMSRIFKNMYSLLELLSEKGYVSTVSTYLTVLTSYINELEQNTNALPYTETIKMFNLAENYILFINKITKKHFLNPYFESTYTWTAQSKDFYNRVNRWIKFLNFAYKALS